MIERKVSRDPQTGLQAKYYRSDGQADPNGDYALISSRKYYQMAFKLFCVFEDKFSNNNKHYSYDDHFCHETSAFAAEQAMRAFMDRFMILVEDLDDQDFLDQQAEEIEVLESE